MRHCSSRLHADGLLIMMLPKVHSSIRMRHPGCRKALFIVRRPQPRAQAGSRRKVLPQNADTVVGAIHAEERRLPARADSAARDHEGRLHGDAVGQQTCGVLHRVPIMRMQGPHAQALHKVHTASTDAWASLLSTVGVGKGTQYAPAQVAHCADTCCRWREGECGCSRYACALGNACIWKVHVQQHLRSVQCCHTGRAGRGEAFKSMC